MPSDPLPFYQHIRTLNERILVAFDEDDHDRIIALLEERSTWMRADNCPTVDSEATERAALIPLMEAILAQDLQIETRLTGHQRVLLEELQATHKARVSQGYGQGQATPDAKFMDRSG